MNDIDDDETNEILGPTQQAFLNLQNALLDFFGVLFREPFFWFWLVGFILILLFVD
jgi:hypothetical protein